MNLPLQHPEWLGAAALLVGLATVLLSLARLRQEQRRARLLGRRRRGLLGKRDMLLALALAFIALAAIGPLVGLLDDLPSLVFDTNTNGMLLPPGQKVTIEVDARPPFNRISFAGMLIPSNDTFVAIDSVRLPRR